MRLATTQDAEDLAVRHVNDVTRDQLHWIFREQPLPDFGIDAHIEVVSGDRVVTGRTIGLQIKGGESYFSAPHGEEGWTFRADSNHLSYWLGHSLPTVVVLVSPEREAFWQVISTRTIAEQDKGFTVVVPRAQRFDADALESLLQIAKRPDGLLEQFPRHLAVLPPDADRLLRSIDNVDQFAAARLAEHLAVGRMVPALTAASLTAAQPTWLTGSILVQDLWRTVAVYARDHQCFVQAADAFVLAAACDGPHTPRVLAEAGLALIGSDRDSARLYLERAREQGEILVADVGLSQLEIPEGDGRPAPIPDSVRTATPEQLAAEPVTLVLLAQCADRRGELDTAVGFAERALAAVGERDTAARMELARLIQRRALMSDLSRRELRRTVGLARQVVEERRRWNGPSTEALELLLDVHIGTDMAAALAAALPTSEGGTALDTESAHPQIAWRAALAALAVGNDTAYQVMMDHVPDGPHRRELLAVEAETAEQTAQQRIDAYTAVLDDPADDAMAARAVAALVKLGVWPPQADQLRTRSMLPGETYDMLQAQFRARTGEPEIGIARLRQMAQTSAHAAHELVRLLVNLQGPDRAIAEAEIQLARWPSSGIGLLLLDLYGKNGRDQQAEDTIERGLGEQSLPADVLLRLAAWYVARRGNRGENTEAAAFAIRALELGENPELAWNLIKCQVNIGDVAAARRALARHRPEPVAQDEMKLWLQLHLGESLPPQDAPALIEIARRLPDGQLRDAAISVLVREVLLTPAQTGNAYSEDVVETTRQLQEQSQNRPGSTLRLDAADDESLRAALEHDQPDPSEYYRLVDQVRQGRASLADVARHAERPYGTALLYRSGGIIPAADLSAALRRVGESAAAAALDSGKCVADLSSLHLLGLLGEDDRLRIHAALPAVLVARSTLADATLTRDHMRGVALAKFIAGLRPDGTVERSALSPVQLAALLNQAESLENLAASMDVAQPSAHTDAAADTIALARQRGFPLWCDDMALRQMARHNNVAAFSILDLITALTDRASTIDPSAVLRLLADHYVVDLPLSAQDITALGADHDWAPGPADTVLGRAPWWHYLGDTWPQSWAHIASVAAAHSDETFLRILTTALAGAIAAVNPGQATQRYQHMLVGTLIACHDSGYQPPPTLLADLEQQSRPGVAPGARYVLANLINALRERGVADAPVVAQRLLPTVDLY